MNRCLLVLDGYRLSNLEELGVDFSTLGEFHISKSANLPTTGAVFLSFGALNFLAEIQSTLDPIACIQSSLKDFLGSTIED